MLGIANGKKEIGVRTGGEARSGGLQKVEEKQELNMRRPQIRRASVYSANAVKSGIECSIDATFATFDVNAPLPQESIGYASTTLPGGHRGGYRAGGPY